MPTNKVLVEVSHLKQYFNQGRPTQVKAVDDVSFEIYQGETFGLVGESGSGKSTVGRALVNLYQPTAGKIIFDGQDLANLKGRKAALAFNKRVQMIFQDPYASLNPRKKVKDIIAEGIDIHHLAANDKDRTDQVFELLEEVGLNRNHASRYPHEFSGGQRQRIGIARALAVKPDFIVADEPISALDVSIQAQVINLLEKLKKEKNLTFLFIAHDLSMVKYFSDRIGMMYHGRLLEVSEADQLYDHPQHAYTKSLLSAIPLPDPDYERNHQRIRFDPNSLSAQAELKQVQPGHWVER
ncbi:ABC transporter ATP-binding protein [Eremococcus coleocola]|uniref:ABC transporter ATP-binding protein n=1 Tax=Eremococcus coleocola TaxID=88132 RepID=UPI00041C8F6F|nr:ATP-binding cassette domain-containing protein [Eremococcus coleocola]